MLEIETQNGFLLFQFDQPKTDQHAFFDPAYWQQQNRLLGTAQGRGNTWILETKDIFGVNTVLRHYYRGGIMRKLNHDQYGYRPYPRTRSVAEFHLLNCLHDAELPVPRAIGAQVERTRFGFYRANLLTEYIEHSQTLAQHLRQHSLNYYQWFKIGAMIRKFHDKQVYHVDLNAHNILLQNQQERYTHWLIDFDRCRFRSGKHWKEDSLPRLKRSLDKEKRRHHIHFLEDDWQTLLAGYYVGMPLIPLASMFNIL